MKEISENMTCTDFSEMNKRHLPDVRVLWRNEKEFVVKCPYCGNQHKHIVQGIITAPCLQGQYNVKLVAL